jgi:hypothetical protein
VKEFLMNLKSGNFVKIIMRGYISMKKSAYFAIIFLLLGIISPAQDKGYGIGIIVGEPSGLSGKYWLNNTNALDFGLGFSFTNFNNSRMQLNCDYLWHNYDWLKTSETLVVYYGPGLKLQTGGNNDAKFGVRGVAGIGWYVKDAPIDVFFEIAPVIYMIPGTSLKIDVGIGARYYFQTN